MTWPPQGLDVDVRVVSFLLACALPRRIKDMLGLQHLSSCLGETVIVLAVEQYLLASFQ